MAVRIMIVDGAAFTRMMLKDIFTNNGFEVVGEAGNGNEAVKKYQELKPDVITMDITMPELDGIAALKQIRAIDPEAKIIMCTALGQQNVVVEAVCAGAKDFVVKPFDPERIVESVQKAAGIL